MAYSSNYDERYLDGYISYYAGTYDLSDSIYSGYGAIAANSLAYGELSQTFASYLGRDTDIYSMGVLSHGTYTVNVDDHTWDFANFDYGSVNEFSVLNSYGGIVATSYSTFSDIEFTV